MIDELLKRLEGAVPLIPQALACAVCCIFLFAMPATLAKEHTWQGVVVILALGLGLVEALKCSIAALRAKTGKG